MKKAYKDLIINVGATSIAVAIMLAPAAVEAVTGIEAGGRRIHGTIVTVGKWVIIVKGSIDCIQSVLNGDIAKAKHWRASYTLTRKRTCLACHGIIA